MASTDFKSLDATGHSNAFNLGVRYPLLRSNSQNIWLNASAEMRALRDDVGATATVTKKEIQAAQFGVSASFQDAALAGAYTQLSWNNTVGNLDIQSADARAIDAASVRTDGAYYKAVLSASRTQYFTPKLSLNASLTAQLANKNLDSSEQVSLGGADAVAAYKSNDVSADRALLAHAELRYDILQGLQAGVFYDVGRARLRSDPYLPGSNTQTLHGGGLSLYAQYKGFYLQSALAVRGGDARYRAPYALWWLQSGYRF